MMTSVINGNTRIKVSSVLNKDNQEYGKQNLIDRNPETCWNSEAGSPQSIALDFGRTVKATKISITFQGGFVGSKAQLFIQNSKLGPKYYQINTCYFDDINILQSGDIFIDQMEDIIEKNEIVEQGFDRLKIQFPESTDFFGRIVVYDLDVLE